MIRADEVAVVKKRRMIPFYLLEGFTIVIVRGPLAHWRFIVYSSYSPDQIVVKIPDNYNYASFLRSPDIFTCLLRQIFPPLLKTVGASCCNAFPFHWVMIFGSRATQFLGECKNISLQGMRFLRLQNLHTLLGLFELRFQPPLIVNLGYLKPFPSDG